MTHIKVASCVTVLVAAAALAQTQPTHGTGSIQTAAVPVVSPNGRLSLEVSPGMAGGSRLSYRVLWDGKVLMEKSDLAMILQGQRPLAFRGSGVRGLSKQHSTYHRISGKASKISDTYTAATFDLLNAAEPQIQCSLKSALMTTRSPSATLSPSNPTSKNFASPTNIPSSPSPKIRISSPSSSPISPPSMKVNFFPSPPAH